MNIFLEPSENLSHQTDSSFVEEDPRLDSTNECLCTFWMEIYVYFVIKIDLNHFINNSISSRIPQQQSPTDLCSDKEGWLIVIK